MRDEFVIYHMTRVMDKFLESLSDKTGLSPLSAVRQNILNFSRDGGKTTVLLNFNAHFFEFIKELQKASDEEAGLKIVEDEVPAEPSIKPFTLNFKKEDFDKACLTLPESPLGTL